eukprot:UN22722
MMASNMVCAMLTLAFVHSVASSDWAYFIHSMLIAFFLTISFSIQTHIVLYIVNHSNIGDLENQRKASINNEDKMFMDTLQSRKAFLQFQDFIRKEYATENLKCFVEICKYKRVVSQ